ncbi:hypothetical protein A4S06_02540 [Erysipelotrichaceae bacterium MTC7]|nr:hypothetical protein A4S06_02540 [Erysipelotrichaceae bacterium MTC7]
MKKKVIGVVMTIFMLVTAIFAGNMSVQAAEELEDMTGANKITTKAITLQYEDWNKDWHDVTKPEGGVIELNKWTQIRLKIDWEAVYKDGDSTYLLLQTGDTFSFEIQEENFGDKEGFGFLFTDGNGNPFSLLDVTDKEIGTFTVDANANTGRTVMKVTIGDLPHGDDPDSPYVVRSGSLYAKGKIVKYEMDSGLTVNGESVFGEDNPITSPEKPVVVDTGANPKESVPGLLKEGIYDNVAKRATWTLHPAYDYYAALSNGQKDDKGKIKNARANAYVEDKLTFNQTLESITVQLQLNAYATTEKDGTPIDYASKGIENGDVGQYSDKVYNWLTFYNENTKDLFTYIEYDKESNEAFAEKGYNFEAGMAYDELKESFLDQAERQTILIYKELDTNGLVSTTVLVYLGDLGDSTDDTFTGVKFTDLTCVKNMEEVEGRTKFESYLRSLTREVEVDGVKEDEEIFTKEQAKYLDTEFAKVGYVIPAYTIKLKTSFADGMMEGENVTNQANMYWKNGTVASDEKKVVFSTYSGTIVGDAKGSATVKKYDLATKDEDVKQTIAESTFGLYKVADGTTPSKNDTLVKEVITNPWGTAKVGGLDAGYYYWKELKAADGYTVEDAIYELDASPDSQTHVFEVVIQNYGQASIVTNVYNRKLNTVDVKLIKYEEGRNDTVTLDDAHFDLYKVATGQDDIKLNDVAYVTDMYGEITVEKLQEGSYYFVETKAPNGYTLSTEKLEFTIDAQTTQTIIVKAYNEKIVEVPTEEPKEEPKDDPKGDPKEESKDEPFRQLPQTAVSKELEALPSIKTGDNNPVNTLLIYAVLSAIVVCCIAYKKRRKEQ